MDVQRLGAFLRTDVTVNLEEDAELMDGPHPEAKDEACRLARALLAVTDATVNVFVAVEHDALSAGDATLRAAMMRVDEQEGSESTRRMRS